MATVDRRRAGTDDPETSHGQPFLFNVDDYYKMAEAEILPRGLKVELIEGTIRVMSPIGSRHQGAVNALLALLTGLIGARGVVSCQGPLRLGDLSEPLPDVLVLKPRPDFYRNAHPTPSDVLWLIEVMDTSSAYDRGEKLAVYAREAIPEVWLVDLRRDRIEAYRRPSGGAYAARADVPRGRSLAPEAFPDVALDADAVLG